MTVTAVNVRRSTVHSLEAEQRLNAGLAAAPSLGLEMEMARVESPRVEDAVVEAQDFAGDVQRPGRAYSRGGEGGAVEMGVFRERTQRSRRKTSAARSMV